MDLKVFLKETACVRPSEQSKTVQTIELSGLDRISPAILYTVFFYKSNNLDTSSSSSSSRSELDGIERAKQALKRVLDYWYPAAGRLRIKEETGKLEINCNGEGVTVVTAETNSKLEELGKLHEYKLCYEKLVPQLPEAGNISDNPLVVVQITKFGCGGLTIGLGGSHALFDGHGAFNFLASWAHISSGKDETDLIIPNHSREPLLFAASTNNPANLSPNVDFSASIYEQDHIVAIQDLYGIPMQAVASDDRCWESELAKFSQIQSKGLQLLTLSINKEVVEAWKGLAVQSGKLYKCSTFDVLCAHVWKARVKALSLEPNTNICLQFPVDSRNRVQPPLGNNFTGNAFVLGSVSCVAKDLIEEPLHKTIRKIQAAKEVITDEYIKLYIKALEFSSDKFFPSMRELTIITDWFKFPFQALDFGWGSVSSAALLATPVPEAVFLMPNLEEPGSFLVRIGIGEQHLGDFVSSFNSFNHN
ncbi:hypothetical protein UlMin_040709 [Ulmus minor]